MDNVTPENNPSEREGVETWLRQTDALLEHERAHSLSPSTVPVATSRPVHTVVSFGSLQEGLPRILGRLVSDPGRWILILEVDPCRANYYVQFLLFEDGSLMAEAVSNHYIDPPYHLSDRAERRLVDLGWDPPPTDDDSPHNWSVVEPSMSPDVARFAKLGSDTLRDVFGAKDGDPIIVKMFSSPNRGHTPAAPLDTTEAGAPSEPQDGPWQTLEAPSEPQDGPWRAVPDE